MPVTFRDLSSLRRHTNGFIQCGATNHMHFRTVTKRLGVRALDLKTPCFLQRNEPDMAANINFCWHWFSSETKAKTIKQWLIFWGCTHDSVYHQYPTNGTPRSWAIEINTLFEWCTVILTAHNPGVSLEGIPIYQCHCKEQPALSTCVPVFDTWTRHVDVSWTYFSKFVRPHIIYHMFRYIPCLCGMCTGAKNRWNDFWTEWKHHSWSGCAS